MSSLVLNSFTGHSGFALAVCEYNLLRFEPCQNETPNLKGEDSPPNSTRETGGES